MDITIKKATPEGLPAMLDIFNYYVKNSPASLLEHQMQPESFAHLLDRQETYPVFVSHEGNQLTGFAMLKPFNPLPTFAHTAEVAYFVHPQYIRRKIGKGLLSKLVKQAKTQGIEQLLACICADNDPSIHFHAKQGFVRCGEFKNVLKKHIRLHHIVWMQKSI